MNDEVDDSVRDVATDNTKTTIATSAGIGRIDSVNSRGQIKLDVRVKEREQFGVGIDGRRQLGLASINGARKTKVYFNRAVNSGDGSRGLSSGDTDHTRKVGVGDARIGRSARDNVVTRNGNGFPWLNLGRGSLGAEDPRGTLSSSFVDDADISSGHFFRVNTLPMATFL